MGRFFFSMKGSWDQLGVKKRVSQKIPSLALYLSGCLFCSFSLSHAFDELDMVMVGIPGLGLVRFPRLGAELSAQQVFLPLLSPIM